MGRFEQETRARLAALEGGGGGGGGFDTAGAGLTSTGTTVNVVANADGSVVVNANDIQVGVLASDAQHGTLGGGTTHAAATTSAAGFLSALDKTQLLAMGVYPVYGGGTTATILAGLSAMRTAGLSQLLLEGTFIVDCGALDDSSSLITLQAGERVFGLGYERSVINIVNTTQGAGQGGVRVFLVEAGADFAAVNRLHFVGDDGARDGTGFTYVLNNENACIYVEVSITVATRHLDFSDNTFECLWGFPIQDVQGLVFEPYGNAFMRAVNNTYRYCSNGPNLCGSFGVYDGLFLHSEGFECSGAHNLIRLTGRDFLGVGCTVGGYQDASANFPGNIVDATIDGCTGAGITVTDGAHGTLVNAFVRHCDDGGLIVNGSVAPPRGVVIRGEYVSNCKDPGSNLNGIYLASGTGHKLEGVQCYDNGDAGFAQAIGLNVTCPDVQVWGGFFGGSAHDVSVGTGATNFRHAGWELENGSVEFISTSSVGAEILSAKAASDLLWATRYNSGSYSAERAYHAVDGTGKHVWGNNLDLLSAQLSTLYRSAADTLKTDGAFVVGTTLAVTGAASASNLSGTNTGDVTIGAFGSSPDAKGASISGQVVTMQPADATHPGMVTTGTQTVAGDKTLTGLVTLNRSGANVGVATLTNQIDSGYSTITATDEAGAYKGGWGYSNGTVTNADQRDKLGWDAATGVDTIWSVNGVKKATFNSDGTLRLDNSVALGHTATPQYQADLGSTTANTKIAMFNNLPAAGSSLAGFGVQSADLRIHMDLTSSKISFRGTPSGASLMELSGAGVLNVVAAAGVTINSVVVPTISSTNNISNKAFTTGNSFSGSPTVSGNVTLSGALTFSSTVAAQGTVTFSLKQVHLVQNSITAFATGGQASATALTGEHCFVTTCATAGDSVKLPVAVAGYRVVVFNAGAASCDVFPQSGSDAGAGTNTAVAVAAGTGKVFYAQTTTQWRSI